MSDNEVMGGEFCIAPDILDRYECNHIRSDFSLGRSCLFAILETIKQQIGGVLLPDYLCRSVVEVPMRLGVTFSHYHINQSFLPDLDSIINATKKQNGRIAIILISYFGLVDLDSIIRLIRELIPDAIVIIDDVQNYYGFGDHIDYDYCFSSYRKWFSVPDGADVLVKKGKQIPRMFSDQAPYIQYKVAGNLLKNHVDVLDDSFSLELLSKGEGMMDDEYRYSGSDIGRKLIRRLDLNMSKNIRKKNAEYLHKRLIDLDIGHLFMNGCSPLFIPITINHRDSVRKKLFSKKIFTPVHWPVEDSVLQGDNELYSTELSLVCDQRYDEDDMEKMIKGIEDAV